MKNLVIALTIILITGCSTSYGKKSYWNDGGFSETEIQPGIFHVRFLGNEFTSTERASNFAMFRASELCLSRGMQYMRVGNVKSETKKTAYIPGSSTTTVNAFGTGYSAYGSSTTTYNPGAALYSPESGLTVACLRENGEGLWDAKFLAQSLKTKYGITEN